MNNLGVNLAAAGEYKVVYDVLQQGLGAAPYLVLLGLLAGIVVGIRLLIRAIRARAGAGIGFCVIWLSLWAFIGGFGTSNVFYQRYRCLQWAKARDFNVVEGQVKSFKPMPIEGHATEEFTVGAVTFKYSDFDLSKGGFNNTTSHGGPIREGLQVRISQRDGRILKLEIRE